MTETPAEPQTRDWTMDQPVALTPLTDAEERKMREVVTGRHWPDGWDPIDFMAGALGTLDALRTATRESAGLDAERVVEAIHNVAARHGIKRDPPMDPSLARIYGYSTTPADMNAQIAAEYARLAAARLPVEGETK